MSVVSQHRAGEDVKKPAPQDTQTRSRLLIGQNGPSDSALAAASGGRLLAAQPLTGTLRAALLGACARACVPRRYTPSDESPHIRQYPHAGGGHVHGVIRPQSPNWWAMLCFCPPYFTQQGAGDVSLIEDTTGKGHLSQHVTGKSRHSIFMPIE